MHLPLPGVPYTMCVSNEAICMHGGHGGSVTRPRLTDAVTLKLQLLFQQLQALCCFGIDRVRRTEAGRSAITCGP